MNTTGVENLRRLGGLTAIALLGLSCAAGFGWRGLEHSLWYSVIASLLLCVGLFMAVFGIDRQEAKQEWRLVVIAVTLGVLCKYALIFGGLYLAIHQWQYAVLSMAMAQIDPLSVAALAGDERMTPRTKTVLAMWASFDDPMTALATPLIVGIATSVANIHLAASQTGVATVYGLVLLTAATAALVCLRYRRGRQLAELLTEKQRKTGTLSAIAVGTATRLYSVPAIAGLVFRPQWLNRGRRVDIITNIALCGATFLLGILLAGGVDWRGGILLGCMTFCSQIVVTWLVLWVAARLSPQGGKSFTKRDGWHLALAQQNGITAIVLALNLEPQISGAIASISLAIVTVNLLHFVVNWAYDRHFDN